MIGPKMFFVLFTTVLFGAASSTTKPVTDEDRIVGGYEADIKDHPYQVNFVVDRSYFCGGFIVSDRYILTAGHCAQNVDPSTVRLRAGSSYRRNGTVIPIAEVIPHPEFNDPAFDKDVAVMKTVDPIPFSDVIQPLSLPPRERRLVADSRILVSGWGKRRFFAGTIPDHLRAVDLPVVDHDVCKRTYSDILSENEFCAGRFVFGGHGACQGDSGSVATQDDFAVGIVSFGRGCGYPLSPSVFADVAAPTIRDFITEHTGL